MPGAVLLVQTPQTRFIESVGWADVKRKIPMRPDHAFRTASTTKMFLGIAAAQMHTEGLLNTDLPITEYLPPSITDHILNSDKITVRQLVRHTSGIYDYTRNLRFQLSAFVFDRRGNWTQSRMLKYAFDKPADFPPGESFRYSNTNFVLLGMIVDRVTGHHHSVEIRNRIIEPLGLTNTYYESYETPRGERAHGYEWLMGIFTDTYDWTVETGGDGGIVSTAADLAVFVRAVTGTDGFLSSEVRALLKSQPNTSPTDKPWYPVLHYDFGVTCTRGAGKDVPVSEAPWFFGHGGATPGYFCFAGHEPEKDITVVYFGSSKQFRLFDQSRIDRFESQLKEALFGLAVEQTAGVSAG
ncbi:MAG: D-alanyl-D-alanine carboxypeptidase [Candidatus Hydrogenedentes bacterium]|nr:D-alanyl-D-alanine carboxypeptidase [Candidatus Hydrogenedentota bacterium]